MDRDLKRIVTWLELETRPRTNGIAVFACAGADVFEGVQLEVPLVCTEVFVAPTPQLFPLAAVVDRYRRQSAVVLDTHMARIFVFGLGEIVAEQVIEGDVPPRSDAGGWSQARNQRHVEEFQRKHVRNAVAALERLARDADVEYVVLAANDVALPLLRAELSSPLAERVIEAPELDMHSSRDRIVRRSLELVSERDARDDADRVRRLLDAHRGGGLGVVGVDATLAALAGGQVHELVVGADPSAWRVGGGRPGAEVAGEMIARARRTGARLTFIEDAPLLAEVGGVGAFLRFRVEEVA